MKLIFIVLIFFGFSYCIPPKKFQNYKEYREEKEIAIIHSGGMRLKVQMGDEKNSASETYYDFLYLTEGKYIIEFIVMRNSARGAALCELKKGKVYKIKITGKKEFPKINRFYLEGECVEDN